MALAPSLLRDMKLAFGLELNNAALRVAPEVQAFAKAQRPIIRADMERASKLLAQGR
ncbi:MAG: hypothetical protein ACR2NX_10135 [Chthoniobacterales bacterium]